MVYHSIWIMRRPSPRRSSLIASGRGSHALSQRHASLGNMHTFVAALRDNLADRPRRQAKFFQRHEHVAGRVARHDQRVADSTIERSPHFTLWNVAFALQPVEYRRQLPGAAVD